MKSLDLRGVSDLEPALLDMPIRSRRASTPFEVAHDQLLLLCFASLSDASQHSDVRGAELIAHS